MEREYKLIKITLLLLCSTCIQGQGRERNRNYENVSNPKVRNASMKGAFAKSARLEQGDSGEENSNDDEAKSQEEDNRRKSLSRYQRRHVNEDRNNDYFSDEGDEVKPREEDNRGKSLSRYQRRHVNEDRNNNYFS
ncbi:MAG: hypothetical protein LBB11_04300, partial [Puniceicoccales bacterium]|nr:hypothetical protein [Puniceicoccales bacterium]